MPELTPYVTIPTLSAFTGISEDKLRAFIASGRLRALDQNPGGMRPRWRIAREDWEQFRIAQSTGPKPARTPRFKLANVKEFF